MTLRAFAKNTEVLFPVEHEEDAGSRPGTMRGASRIMRQTPRKARQREGSKCILNNELSCRIKPHLKPVSLWTYSCEPINFLSFFLDFLMSLFKQTDDN